VFLDESTRSRRPEHGGAEVSRAGVQRDLLPVVEGTTVNTRYGIETDHVLFIASGAFPVVEVCRVHGAAALKFHVKV